MTKKQCGDYQFDIYFDGLEGRTPNYPVDFPALERAAAEVLPPRVLSYVAGGAGFAIPEVPPVFGGASGTGDRVRYPHRVRRHPASGRRGARLLGLALWPRWMQNGIPSARC
jgi:hypothetical protein